MDIINIFQPSICQPLISPKKLKQLEREIEEYRYILIKIISKIAAGNEMTGLVKKLLMCGSRRMPAPAEEEDDEDEEEEGNVKIWVKVGTDEESIRRFSVEADFLNHPLFEDLLRLSEGVFGYSYAGALRIACDADLFLHLLALLRRDPSSLHHVHLQLPDLINSYYAGGGPAPTTSPL